MEWYGERTTHQLFKGVAPDGYGVLALPGRPPVHLLLELDRATEPAQRLRQKAVGYARQIPQSELSEYGTLVILAVPTATRAKLAREAIADTGAPDRGRRMEQSEHAVSARDRHRRHRPTRRTSLGVATGCPAAPTVLPIPACRRAPMSDP
jgi:hypothetical protein